MNMESHWYDYGEHGVALLVIIIEIKTVVYTFNWSIFTNTKGVYNTVI